MSHRPRPVVPRPRHGCPSADGWCAAAKLWENEEIQPISAPAWATHRFRSESNFPTNEYRDLCRPWRGLLPFGAWLGILAPGRCIAAYDGPTPMISVSHT
jgi:hypothetical protein